MSLEKKSKEDNRAASATIHLSVRRRDKLRVLSRIAGFGGELSPFLDSLADEAIVKADLMFQCMSPVFGNAVSSDDQTEGDGNA